MEIAIATSKKGKKSENLTSSETIINYNNYYHKRCNVHQLNAYIKYIFVFVTWNKYHPQDSGLVV